MDDTARQISDAILRILVAEPTLSPEQRQALTTATCKPTGMPFERRFGNELAQLLRGSGA